MQCAIVNWLGLRVVSIEYFGVARQLLGALHVPQRLRRRATAVLLCNPFGEEASRAHRTFRVLATQLERAGYASLRFDYSSTGDSQGDSDWLSKELERCCGTSARSSGNSTVPGRRGECPC